MHRDFIIALGNLSIIFARGRRGIEVGCCESGRGILIAWHGRGCVLLFTRRVPLTKSTMLSACVNYIRGPRG